MPALAAGLSFAALLPSRAHSSRAAGDELAAPRDKSAQIIVAEPTLLRNLFCAQSCQPPYRHSARYAQDVAGMSAAGCLDAGPKDARYGELAISGKEGARTTQDSQVSLCIPAVRAASSGAQAAARSQSGSDVLPRVASHGGARLGSGLGEEASLRGDVLHTHATAPWPEQRQQRAMPALLTATVRLANCREALRSGKVAMRSRSPPRLACLSAAAVA